ncbi:MAG: hypothetical protein ACREE0_11075 [Phenylobacterium sp.]
MAKKSKALLPKRIGKVKVAKAVRKGALADVLTSKAGQALIAQAVIAVGAVAAARLKKNGKVRSAVAAAKLKGGAVGEEANAATATLTYALGEAVRSFSEALHRAPADRPPGGDGGGWAPLPASRRTKAAKPRARRPAPEASPST